MGVFWRLTSEACFRMSAALIAVGVAVAGAADAFDVLAEAEQAVQR